VGHQQKNGSSVCQIVIASDVDFIQQALDLSPQLGLLALKKLTILLPLFRRAWVRRLSITMPVRVLKWSQSQDLVKRKGHCSWRSLTLGGGQVSYPLLQILSILNFHLKNTKKQLLVNALHSISAQEDKPTIYWNICFIFMYLSFLSLLLYMPRSLKA
jgi:hypothetical protein